MKLIKIIAVVLILTGLSIVDASAAVLSPQHRYYRHHHHYRHHRHYRAHARVDINLPGHPTPPPPPPRP